jgi:hypothetical protein
MNVGRGIRNKEKERRKREKIRSGSKNYNSRLYHSYQSRFEWE